MKLKKLLLLVMIAALSVSVFACRNSDDSSSSQKPQEVLITLSENELNMRVGENKTVTANVTGSSATVEWVTSAPEVATVEGGVISAVSKGSAVITATVEEKSATVTVNVANTASLTLESDKLSVNAETWTDKDNTVYGKTTVSITPILTVNGTVTDGTFTYECADENVAEVDDNGVVTGKKIGTTAIEVSCVYDGETLKTTATVTVKKVDIASKEAFTFGGDKNEWVIDVTRFGLTADDVIAIYLEDGTDYVQTDDAGEIIYDGNSAKVITAGIDVDKKTEPDTVIIETEGLLISIKIAYVSANNVEFVSESSPMVIGSQKQLKLYAFGVEVSESAEWSVNKDYIATIDDEGVLTAVNYGTVKVTAKVYGYTYTTVQVVVKEESPKTAMEAVTVHNYTTGGDHYGYKQTTHGQYAAGDWVRFSFTPSEDFNGMLYVYYGLNNLEDKFEENFPNGCAFAFAGSKKFSGNIFTDSSFIVLDKDGIQVGSIAEKTGAGIYKKGETYTVYVQIPDDGSVDHDLFIKFASENHLVEEQVMRGVLSWRDNLDNASCAIEVKNVSGYIYSGETRRNIYDVEGKLSFRGASLETENSIDVASLGINSEVITAYLKDASFEVILKDENGKPVITNGKLTVLNTFFTQCGTNGVKTLVLETEEDRYNVPFEIVPVDEKRNGAVALIPGLADYIFVDTAKMVSEINAGRQFLAFDVYSDGFGDNAYIYFQIGARHIYVKNNCAYIHSTWDGSRKDKITANFIRVIDEEGSLVYDTVTWGGSKMFGTKSDSMQPGKWYKVIIDMDGRAWDDSTCMQYLSYSHAMATVVGMNAYFNNIKTYSTAEFEGIVLDREEAVLAEGESVTLIATLSELLTGTKVIWTSSLEEVATVTLRLDRSFGLLNCKRICVISRFPTEKFIGEFDYGASVNVELKPFRAALIELCDSDVCDEVVLNAEYKVLHETENGVIDCINVLKYDGKNAPVLYNPRTGKKRELKFKNEQGAFDFVLKAPQKLGVLADCKNENEYGEFLYETACFSADNLSLERRSVFRSGKTAIKEVERARKEFFEQYSYKIRGLEPSSVFKGDGIFDVKSRAYYNHDGRKGFRVDGGCLRVDFCKEICADRIEIEYFDAHEANDMFEKQTVNVGEYSADLKEWKNASPAVQTLYKTENEFLYFYCDTPGKVPGDRMRATFKIGENMRYFRIKEPIDRIYSIKIYSAFGEVKLEEPKLTNLFAHYSEKKTVAMQSAVFTLKNLPQNPYLAVAFDGETGEEGVMCVAEINGKIVGFPSRAPAFPSNAFEYPVHPVNGYYTFFLPLDKSLENSEIKITAVYSGSKVPATVYLCDGLFSGFGRLPENGIPMAIDYEN